VKNKINDLVQEEKDEKMRASVSSSSNILSEASNINTKKANRTWVAEDKTQSEKDGLSNQVE
jgi:hypothetical protein